MTNCCSVPSTADGQMAKPASVPVTNCPGCGQPGKPVAVITLKQTAQPQWLDRVNKPGFLFCRTAECDLVYFHPDGTTLSKSDVRVRVGLKETEGPVPLCYCFGFTKAMVVEEIRETGKCTIPQRINAEVKAGHCACEIRNPQGSCCLGNVAAAVKKAMAALAAEKTTA